MEHRHLSGWHAGSRLGAAAVAFVSLVLAACGGEAAGSPTPTATPVATVATPIATATPDVPATYVVKSGDTGLEIAARFGITLEALAQANNVTTVQLNSLQIGQQLRIPR